MSQTTVPTQNKKLQAWVEEIAALTKPDQVHWCDGSAEEYDELAQGLVDARHLRAALRRQAPELLPGAVGPRRRGARRGPHVHLLARPRRTPGPTNNWRAPDEMRETLDELFDGCMEGRTMYVVPFSMGPLGSPIAHIGVQLTDSAYVAVSMRIMTRMGAGRSRRARRGRRVRALRALRRRAAGRRRGGRAMALQRRQQVHRPLPRDARDLVVRLGLRRQRAAGQEVLRAADRLGHGARRGLDGRAHADPQAHRPRGPRRRSSPARSRPPAARPTSRC